MEGSQSVADINSTLQDMNESPCVSLDDQNKMLIRITAGRMALSQDVFHDFFTVFSHYIQFRNNIFHF